jgi:dTDP-4-amino-4,6-dideoxygalactose transaminase
VAVHVTRSLVPPLADVVARLETIWKSGQFTNHGALVAELEASLAERLASPGCVAVANGTLAIQVACAALGLRGEVVTTPLSFVATSSALTWMGLEPVFADVDPETLTLAPASCAERIGPRTSALLATHVYGLPCDVDGLTALARERGIALLFDASHTFGCRLWGRPLAAFGDVSAMSLHATKILHTAEGGLLATGDLELAARCRVRRDFGFDGLRSLEVPGVNAKLSELHAALGLSVLPLVDAAIAARRMRYEAYAEALAPALGRLRLLGPPPGLEWNYGYCPLVLPDEPTLVRAWAALAEQGVFARRYFHPALHTLPWTGDGPAPVAAEVAPRLLCLPLHHELAFDDIERITAIVRAVLGA